jgi:predicted cobalt transporter CbtA
MTTERRRRVDPTRLGSLALAAGVVGLLAGIVAAVFASVAAEPAIDDAIAIEEANAAAADEAAGDDAAMADEGHEGEASVSRADQRGVGLFAAYGLSGIAFGLLTALTAHGLRHGRPHPGPRVLMAGAILAGGITLAPWLKYPPNPPAVGDPDTLAQRQGWYVTVILVAVALGLLATVVSSRLRSAGWADHRRLAVVAATVVVPMLVVFALFPGAPDDIPVPASLVWRFRVASLGANATLWALLTFGLSWVVSEATAPAEARRPERQDDALAG